MNILSFLILALLTYGFSMVTLVSEKRAKKIDYIIEQEKERIVLRNRKGQFVKYLYYGE